MDAVSTQKLLLIGAGHAHIGLLRQLTHKPLNNIAVTLITEQSQSIYSGMLPGWMAGHYELAEITIDAELLCQQAGVRLVKQSLAKVAAESCSVMTTNSEHYSYEVLSLNTGADTDMSWLRANDINKEGFNINSSVVKNIDFNRTVIPIRPLCTFIECWQDIVEQAKQTDHYQLAIVGAGAAAVELVLAAQYALQRISPKHQAYLVCGDQLLSGFAQRFTKQVIKQLQRHRIEIIEERAKGYSDGKLLTSNKSLSVDAVIAATGVIGAAWTAHTDVKTLDDGFVAVNAVQQSISHPNVFAVGDTATRVDQLMAHSGVHAVFGGIVEGANLLAYLAAEPLKKYKPKNRTLYLLACGDQYAIGSWGKFSVQGRWVWQLKRYIDKRFVNAK